MGSLVKAPFAFFQALLKKKKKVCFRFFKRLENALFDLQATTLIS